MNNKEKLEKELLDLKFRRSKLIKEKAASPVEIVKKNLQIQMEIARVEKLIVESEKQ